ncbi:MAG: hypothetical protein WBQ42_03725 [Candidatus Rickettsiella isopodorum]
MRLDPYRRSAAFRIKKNSICIRRSDSSSSAESTNGSSHFAQRIAAKQVETKLTLSRNELAKELLSVFQSIEARRRKTS